MWIASTPITNMAEVFRKEVGAAYKVQGSRHRDEALEGLNTHRGIHQHIVDELGVHHNGLRAGRLEEN